MNVYNYEGKTYPDYLKHGNAAKYIIPIAQNFCKGKGLDIGGLSECHFPDATIIQIRDRFTAYNLPDKKYDYIFSSHTLEHLNDYVVVLEQWTQRIKKGGTLFLYLPHKDMTYWRPFNNRWHVIVHEPENLKYTLEKIGYKNIMYSGRDLFWSFSIVGEKC